jgi:mono/diheme cytochrome c family protein
VAKILLGFIAGLFVVVLLAAVFLLVHGIAAKPPGKMESRLITGAKHSLLVGNKGAKNPLQSTRDNIDEGRENFSHYCYACHGLDGQATGVPFSDSMSPPVPSLASRSVQSYSDGQLYWVIKNGVWPSGMPAAKGILTDDEMWSLVLYIRHLPPAGSLGEPPAYSGEGSAPTSKQ